MGNVIPPQNQEDLFVAYTFVESINDVARVHEVLELPRDTIMGGGTMRSLEMMLS
jgi:hypothetical protein